MMPITLITRYDGWEALLTRKGNLQRQGREILREGFRLTASAWHRRYAGYHFRAGNTARYGYQRRKAAYRRRKRRMAETGTVQEGGSVALVYSGTLRDKALSMPQIKAFPTRGRAIMHAPAFASMRPRGDKPNISQEMTATIRSERQDLEAVQKSNYEHSMKQIRATATVTASAG